MNKIFLGFRAFDPHELLCHFVAAEAGLYTRENLQVGLIDITFIPDTGLPEHVFQTGCGAALAGAVKGLPLQVAFVATDRPMFWLYSNCTIKTLQEIKGGRIATYPAAAPPHHFCNIILDKAGIDTKTGVTLTPARDDVARLGLLKTGNADAAVISSAVTPQRIEGAGMNKLCFFGDELRIPTTGLAMHRKFLEREAGLIDTLVNLHKESLGLIHKDTGLVASVLQQVFDVPEDISHDTALLYRQYYTLNGRTTPEIAQHAVELLSANLDDPAPVSWEDIYRY